MLTSRDKNPFSHLCECEVHAGFCLEDALGRDTPNAVEALEEDIMVNLKVNGMDRSFDGDPDMPLLWYLRDVLGLTGTKFGCGIALCGACTIHKNGEAIRSSVTPMSAAADVTFARLRILRQTGAIPCKKPG